MANIPIHISQRGTTTLKTKGKVCREDIDVIIEVEGGQNYLEVETEEQALDTTTIPIVNGQIIVVKGE